MSLLKSSKIDATQGNLLHGIILYAIPLILSTLIQTCFNAVDLIVLGNLANAEAVASVGATTSITSLVVSSFVGIASGAKIILARQFGARDSDRIQKTADTVVLTALGLGMLIALLGVPFAPQLLHLTNCPPECFDGAVIYIRIYIAAAPAILLYNFGSAIITSSGDSRRPMLYILVSGLVNVILNIILCLILEQKVAAVAIATVASQLVAAALVLYRLCHIKGDGHINLFKMRFHPHSFKRIMQQGIPLALSTALYPLANLQIQSAVNSFGYSATAGNAAGAQIEGFVGCINSSMSATVTVFMGQNIGAHKRDRVMRSFWTCLILGVTAATVIGAGIYLSGRVWLSLFLPEDPVAIEYGMIRMFYVILFYAIACVNGVLSHAIQTYGYSTYSAFASICCIFGFRMIWMWFVYPQFRTFHMLTACFLVSWTLLMLFNIVGVIVFRRRFERHHPIL